MTNLVNERKAMKDSMASGNEKNKYYINKAMELSERTHDKALVTPYFDSANMCLEKLIPVEDKFKALEFSIDSLSKMK